MFEFVAQIVELDAKPKGSPAQKQKQCFYVDNLWCDHAIFQLLNCYNCYKIIKFKSGVFPISQWSVLLKFLHIFILFIYSRKRVKLPSMYLR